MFRIRSVHLIIAFFLSSVAGTGEIITLTDFDFGAKLAKQDVTLVKFYAPW